MNTNQDATQTKSRKVRSITPSGSLGGNKIKFCVIACSLVKDVGYADFDAK